MPPSPRRPRFRLAPHAAGAAFVALAGCSLVMDVDFDKYHAAELVADASGGAGGSETGGSAGSSDGGTAGDGGMAGTAGAGGTVSVDASTDEPVGPTCDDGVLNQGEEKIDCGGPCPPCPGFTHFETFDTFPTPGPDGPYAVYGVCDDDTYVDGWVLSNTYNAEFPQGTGYYAVIDTLKKPMYLGLECDDNLATPELPTNQSTQVTLSFDATFSMLTASHAEVILERDGVPEKVWSKYTNFPAQRVTLGNLPIDGVQKVRVLFRYVGEYDGHWMVDNIAVVGE